MSQVFQMYQRGFVFQEVPLYLRNFLITPIIFQFLLVFRLTNQMLHIKHVARLSQVDSSGLHLHRGSWSGSIPVVNTHDAEREMRLGGEISTVMLSQQGLLPVLHVEL